MLFFNIENVFRIKQYSRNDRWISLWDSVRIANFVITIINVHNNTVIFLFCSENSTETKGILTEMGKNDTEYSMTKSKRGFCLIFNQQKFDDPKKVSKLAIGGFTGNLD